MTKTEILNLIEANRIINKNEALLSIAKNKIFKNKTAEKEYWFPNIEELKEEFNILTNEVKKSLEETNFYKKQIQNSNCNHQVRLKHYVFLGGYSTCVFCGQSVTVDNCTNWEYSINRNKYCVDLIAKYQDDDDYDYISGDYTNELAYEIILNILKNKKDNEEIDLVQEFKKLNLKDCIINEEQKVNENYILIISGSNKHFIDNETYLFKKGLKTGLDFIKYFSSLLNTKIELIDNIEVLESIDFHQKFKDKNYNLKFVNYDTIEQLKENLSSQRKIPFKIIIDLSELYQYKINNNILTKEVYNLKLKEFFPNSNIIKIGNLSKRNKEELLQYLNTIQTFDNIYAYQNNVYNYLEENYLKYDNLENTCRKIKRLLKK